MTVIRKTKEQRHKTPSRNRLAFQSKIQRPYAATTIFKNSNFIRMQDLEFILPTTSTHSTFWPTSYIQLHHQHRLKTYYHSSGLHRAIPQQWNKTHDYDRDSYIGAFNVIRSKEVTNSENQSVTKPQICRTYEKYHNPIF
jgi:hypothetical protein